MRMPLDQSASVERSDHVGPLRKLAVGALNRFVVAPDQIAKNTPFILLVEDFLEPSTEFDPHPHSAFETVTFIVDGGMRYGDNVGNDGTADIGDVLWMTAGRGIVHGGHPVDYRPVHALQLWMALPGALRDSAPGMRAQARADALTEVTSGATARIYGAASLRQGEPDWSRWPMTLTDITVNEMGRHSLALYQAERSFVYVLDGELELNNTRYGSGDVVWFAPATTIRNVGLTTIGGARIVHYSAPPIDEPIMVRGASIVTN